jgi:stage II sporulation protein M
MPNIQHELADMFQDIIGDSFAFDFTMVVKIFINNSTSALLMIFGGVFLGLIPIFAIFLNGFIIGYVLIGSLLSLPADIIKTVYVSFATILPHGVFEIPAILFSAALGMRFGIEWMQKTSACHRDSMFRKTFIQAVTAVPVLMLILFVAAILEVFVSSRIGYALVNEHPFVWN